MAKVVRSFPDVEISPEEYGPEPRALYRDVKAELDQQDRGTLRVVLDDETVLVFVNERLAGVGTQALEELYPGRYRVFVRRGNVAGRVHETDVALGTERQVSIKWGLDASLRTDAGYVGFEFENEAGRRASEAEYSARVARRVEATGVAVVGIRTYRGRRSIVGTVVDMDTGKPVRTGAIAIEPVPPGHQEIRALARFLAGGRPAPGIMVGEELMDDARTDGRRETSPWAWATLGTGVLAMAGGAALIAMDDPEIQAGDRQDSFRDTMVPGILTAAGGAVLTGIGIYLWRRSPKETRRTETAIVPTVGDTWGLAVMGSF